MSIGLLPDCLASRTSGSLDRVEEIALALEDRRGVERTANEERPDAVALPGAVRWVRRRSVWVRELLAIVVTLLADTFEGCAPTIRSMRACLGIETGLLRELRALGQRHVHALPRPVGLVPAPYAGAQCVSAYPQSKGADPPRGAR